MKPKKMDDVRVKELLRKYPFMDRLMAETLLVLDDAGKLESLLAEKNDDGRETETCEDKNPN